MRFITLSLLVLLLFLVSCRKETVETTVVPETDLANTEGQEGINTLLQLSTYQSEEATERSLSDITLTPDFQSWLTANGYGSYQFSNPAIDGDSYGGKSAGNMAVSKQPVIFIHGNGDKAVGYLGTTQSGWTGSLNHFLANGYTRAELYAITWGDADPFSSYTQTHSKPHLQRIRAFIEAVLDYTGASKVDIVCHSMGVTLCRKAIKGGAGYDPDNGGNYNLGPALTSSIDAFVGIAGANKGLSSCYFYPASVTATCNDVTGFYPGYLYYGYGPYGVSDYLLDINSSSTYEGSYRYSIWSPNDEIITLGCVVYGANTCYIPGQTGKKSYSAYGHFLLKDMTGSCQRSMVLNHTIP